MKKFDTVDAYIKGAPPELQEKLKQIRRIILDSAVGVTEKISYGMPYYGYKGRLAYFAYFKNHIGFYAMNGVLLEFKDEVKSYQTGRATLRFDLKNKIPYGLIKRLVKATVKINTVKAK